jgi:integrase
MARRDYSTGSLLIEPRARGREVWIGQWYEDGRQRQRVLGDVRKAGARSGEGMSRTQAEKALRDARADTLTGRERESGSNPGLGTLMLHDASEMHFRWLEGRGRKARTVEGYREMTSAHLVPYFKDRDIAKITHRDVEAFIDHMRSINRKPETIKNYVNLLHAILKTAVRRGLVTENVVDRADNVPTGQSGDGVIRYLRMEDVDAIIRAEHDDDLGHTMQTIYVVATMTGLRMGEIRALRWESVDFIAGKIRVEYSYAGGRLTRPKSRRSQRAVPMPPPVAQALAQHSQRSLYAGDDDLVFCHPHHGSYLSGQTIRDRFKKACANGGVRKVRFHDLRHTYGTLMASAGTPLRVLQGLMGHASYSTTEIYAKWAPDQAAELAYAERAFAARSVRAGVELGSRVA